MQMALLASVNPNGSGNGQTGRQRRTMKNRLKELMQEKGVTQQQLADLLGVSRPSISYWARGESLTIDTATAICSALGVSLNDLFGIEMRGGEAVIKPNESIRAPGFERIYVQSGQERPLVTGFLDLASSFVYGLLGVNDAKSLQIIPNKDDCMEPTINKHSLVIVDTAQTILAVNGIYCLQAGKDLFIKRVQRNLDGSITLLSDNRLYEPIRVEKDELEGLGVHGKVIHIFNSRSV